MVPMVNSLSTVNGIHGQTSESSGIHGEPSEPSGIHGEPSQLNQDVSFK